MVAVRKWMVAVKGSAGRLRAVDVDNPEDERESA
jgi:hypothetical protein